MILILVRLFFVLLALVSLLILVLGLIAIVMSWIYSDRNDNEDEWHDRD